MLSPQEKTPTSALAPDTRTSAAARKNDKSSRQSRQVRVVKPQKGRQEPSESSFEVSPEVESSYEEEVSEEVEVPIRTRNRGRTTVALAMNRKIATLYEIKNPTLAQSMVARILNKAKKTTDAVPASSKEKEPAEKKRVKKRRKSQLVERMELRERSPPGPDQVEDHIDTSRMPLALEVSPEELIADIDGNLKDVQVIQREQSVTN